MYSQQAVIRDKRDGRELGVQDLRAFAAGIANGTVCDGQLGAFAMAVWLNGMTRAETVALTLAMRDSGRCLDWHACRLHGPVLDKHSTGGIGDCTSLLVAPILAACGAYVPMLSGRGLGHTGGTLDKLEAIPGFCSDPGMERMVETVRTTGLAIVGASAEVAPADRRLYAVRDVTATVDAMALIIASILSKKLAAGLDALVLDVKCGAGASLSGSAQARELAAGLVEVADGAGLSARALLSDMSQALAPAAGNALEVRLALACLRGERLAPRLVEVSLELSAMALCQGGLAHDLDQGRAQAAEVLANGAAAERFAAMVSALGGPADLLEKADTYLPAAPCQAVLPAACDGYLAEIDPREVGEVVIDLGGGRRYGSDQIDPRVGIDEMVPVGTRLCAGDALLRVHAANEASLGRALKRLQSACRIQPEDPEPIALLQGWVGLRDEGQ